MKKAIATYYLFIPLLLLCIFYGYQAIDFPLHDFANYYFGGKFLATGNFNEQIYFPYEFNNAIFSLGYKNVFASYAPNTPFLALLFVPFAILTSTTAKLVFNFISIGLFVFSIYRLFSFYKINPKFALLIPVLFLVPIKNNLLFGQVYFLLFFLLAEGWIAYEKEQLKWMAFFWSLAILLKVFPVLLIVLLLFKKQWKELTYLAISGLLLFGVTVIFTGTDIWLFYLKIVLPKSSNGEIASAFVDNYQSVFMFLKRIFVYDAIENPKAFFDAPIWFAAILVTFKIGLVVLGFFITRKSGNKLQILGFWILVMILVSPYGSTYTFILLLFPFFALLKSEISHSKKIAFCATLFLICNLPLSIFIDREFPISYFRLVLLLLLFVLFMIQIQQKFYWKTIAITAFASMIFTFVFRKNEPIKSAVFLQDGPMLVYDYEIKNNQLTYFYWDENGENKTSISCKCSSSTELDIKENQIVSKKSILTFDKSHKYKPTLLDNKTVFYLSDYGRGIGFYTLRKIDLIGK